MGGSRSGGEEDADEGEAAIGRYDDFLPLRRDPVGTGKTVTRIRLTDPSLPPAVVSLSVEAAGVSVPSHAAADVIGSTPDEVRQA